MLTLQHLGVECFQAPTMDLTDIFILFLSAVSFTSFSPTTLLLRWLTICSMLFLLVLIMNPRCCTPPQQARFFLIFVVLSFCHPIA